jgi:transglycosylase-like protein with SLT domain
MRGLALATTSAIVIAPAKAGGLSAPRTAAPAKVAVSVYSDMVLAEFPDAPVMLRIAQAESHMLPEAKNAHSTAAGLFQILSGTWSSYRCTGDKYDASDNIACARKIYDKEGTRPWASSGSW